MPENIILRPALPADAPRLAEIFRASIDELAREDYSEAQIEAWMAQAEDQDAFAAKLAGELTIVALLRGEVAGFASLKGTDALDMLYVHPLAARKGVGTHLCEAMEKLAAARKAVLITADVADSALDFFTARKYAPLQRNMIFLGDEVLGNTTMTKKIAAATGRMQ